MSKAAEPAKNDQRIGKTKLLGGNLPMCAPATRVSATTESPKSWPTNGQPVSTIRMKTEGPSTVYIYVGFKKEDGDEDESSYTLLGEIKIPGVGKYDGLRLMRQYGIDPPLQGFDWWKFDNVWGAKVTIDFRVAGV